MTPPNPDMADVTPPLPVASDAAGAAMIASVLRGQDAGVERPGDEAGLYTLVEKLGDGGFGSVWRAVQEEPIGREVALKIIKPGMDSLEVLGRFEQERAALSMMDHPNIARVLDAGTTARGRPFFVMELVNGVPITTYAIRHGLGVRERLGLFKDVCAGVQHAHQKGIIHRDLKPSNILVTEVDGVPVPKIIDFGIAKAVSAAGHAGSTLMTRAEQMIGTPLYMSPEQARGSPDIDTRSDVYALGVLLYELLTGQPPFDASTLMHAGHEEMRRVISEVQPRKPSVLALQTSRQGQARDGAAKCGTRSMTHGVKLRIDRDLDLITLRALEKDRVRRYESATAFADDIRRFLNHEAVTARAPSMLYLGRRWARRHRSLAVAAVVCLLAIIAGSSVAVWQAVRATRSEARAVANAQDADAAMRVVMESLRDFDPTKKGRAFNREELSRELVRRVKHFSGDPVRKADMLLSLATITRGEETIKVLDEALALARPALAADDPKLWQFRFALAWRGANQNHPERIQQGVDELRELLPWARAHFGEEDSRTVRCGYELGRGLGVAGRWQEALDLLAQACETLKSHPGLMSSGERSFFRMDYAGALFKTGHAAEALDTSRENVRLMVEEQGEKFYDTARAMFRHAGLCRDAGELSEAAASARRALGSFLASVGPLDTMYDETLDLLLAVLTQQQDTEGLLALHRDVLRVHDEKLGPMNKRTSQRAAEYEAALVAAKRLDEADKLATGWLSRRRTPEGAIPADCEQLLRPHIGVLRGTAQWPRAEAALRDLIALVEHARPDDVQRWGDTDNLGDVLNQQHKFAEAIPVLEKSIAALEKTKDDDAVKRLHLPQARRRLERARSGRQEP